MGEKKKAKEKEGQESRGAWWRSRRRGQEEGAALGVPV